MFHDDGKEKKPNFIITAQKMKFSIRDIFSKCDKIRGKLRIWSHLLQKSLMQNLTFHTVDTTAMLTKFYFLVKESDLTSTRNFKFFRNGRKKPNKSIAKPHWTQKNISHFSFSKKRALF